MKLTSVFSAAAALLFVATAAQAQRGRDDRRGGGQDQHQQAAPQQHQQRQDGDQRGDVQRGRDDQGRADQARAEQARADQARAEQARSPEQSQRRVAEQSETWRQQQNRQAQQEQFDRARRGQQEEQLERDRQLDRDRQLERERQLEASRVLERDRVIYNRGPDVRFAPVYRYYIGGAYRETSQYGADIFRQAIDRGYDEGYRAGLNDRRDGMRADFQRALDFESGSFGYTGGYVPADDYGYYFRQGFQRGYDDGYWNRSNYGTFSNGTAAVLGAVALGILGLTLIH